jgi:hypothetical protein
VKKRFEELPETYGPKRAEAFGRSDSVDTNKRSSSMPTPIKHLVVLMLENLHSITCSAS